MANGANPWLSSAFQNTSNPNQDYQSYLEGLGMDIDPSKVGQFFGGITEDYQEDVGMARAGFAQGMSGLRTQGQSQAMQLGGGQGLASIGGGGFGGQGYRMQQGLQGIGQQYGQGLQAGLLGYTGDLQSAQRGMESSFRDVATGLLGRDSAGISWEGTSGGNGGGFSPPGWTSGTPSDSTTFTDTYGVDWIYQNGSWRQENTCFISGTKILMSNGKEKNIESIKEGESVLSFDEKTKEYISGIVTVSLIHPIHRKINVAIVENSLFGSPDHPIFINNKWNEISKSNIDIEYKKMYIENYYNLEIDGHLILESPHNYIANGYIVSGLGDHDILNDVFCRQDIFKVIKYNNSNNRFNYGI